jgi:hypothetical protein
VKLELSNFSRRGLYIILENLKQIDFTDENIKKITEYYWNDSDKISYSIRKAVDFQRCDFCQLKNDNDNDICNAIKPILPLIDFIKEYKSFDKVTAVYVDNKNIVHVSYTTMQEALKYLSMISLLDYCLEAKLYKKYYYGVNPLLNPEEIAKRLYINAFWINRDIIETTKFIKEFTKKMTVTSVNQIKRINQVCQKDSLANAFVNTQLSSMLMSLNIEDSINNDMEKILSMS